MSIVTIAMMTVREVSRRRLVLALVVLSGVAIALTGWGFSRLPGLHDRGVPLTNAELLVISSQLLIFGGVEVSRNTLLRFYVLHVILLPLVVAVFLAVHFWRIRKDGGISGPL